ncbi:hypothetical protein VNO80_16796 [Phaseolus coccineus]|uniref:Uncharacterized protein n=1 Tax=Phaseolus coccineus TaxID=3886 RepID=A0AAN9MSC7_PHACN
MEGGVIDKSFVERAPLKPTTTGHNNGRRRRRSRDHRRGEEKPSRTRRRKTRDDHGQEEGVQSKTIVEEDAGFDKLRQRGGDLKRQ